MKDNKNTRWALLVFVAAVVAALTTLTLFCLRARAKKKALSPFKDSIDYDFDDCCCDGCEDCCCDDSNGDSVDAPVQIPVAKPEDDDNGSTQD